MGSAVLACFLSPVTGPAAWLLFDPMAWPRLSPDFCHLTWTMTRPQSVSPLLSLVSRHRAALWMKRLDGEESGLHRLVLASPPAPERQLCGPAPNPRPREQPGSKRRRPQAQLPSFRADRCWGHICVVTAWTHILVWSCCVETTAICAICVTRTQAGGAAANQPSQVLGTLAASGGAGLPQRRHLWALRLWLENTVPGRSPASLAHHGHAGLCAGLQCGPLRVLGTRASGPLCDQRLWGGAASNRRWRG